MRLLGPLELAVGSERVPLPAPKVRALLGLLAVDANTPVPSASLVDRLWAGRPPESAASVLRTYVSQLRVAMPDGADRLVRSAAGYELRLREHELDASAFTAELAAATAAGVSPFERARLLRSALRLWRGPPLAELADDPRACAEAARLQAARWAAVEALADAELAVGRPDVAVAELEPAVHQEPLREQLVARLMLALYRSGRQAEALAAYRQARRALLDELGVDPSPELRRLEARILQQDAGLDAPPSAGNLPTPLTPLVGREPDLERLAAALAANRLVTLTGPGGAGKTRLALAAAAAATGWPDGACLVELATCRSATQVPVAALAALGVPQRLDEPPAATLRSFLAERRMLLLVDNCEQVARAAADLVAGLLPAAPGVAVLATSRSPLGVAGELVLPVAPLGVPGAADDPGVIAKSPAAVLLAQRVAAARGGHGPAPHEWPAVGELCRRLDGLPLALELVAAKAGALSLGDLAGTLDRQLFQAKAPEQPDHRGGLAGCVQWSLELLSERSREALQQLSGVPGPFSTAAAAAATGCSRADVVAVLGELADASLVQPVAAGSGRFRLLETVRQVVRSRLDGATAEATLDRLTAWAADWTEELAHGLRGPSAVSSLDLVEQELPLLHAALEHALSGRDPQAAVRIASAMSPVWAYRGYVRDGQRWLDRTLAVADPVPPALRVRLMVAAGTHRLVVGDVEGFGRLVGPALALARDGVGTPDMLKALLWAARALVLRDARAAARELYEEALRLARARDDLSSAASALAGLGDVAAAGGELAAAEDLHRQSLALFRAAEDPHGEGQALLNLAETDRLAGRLPAADAGFRAARSAFERIADRSCIAACDEGRARVADDDGRHDDAAGLLHDVVAVRRDLGQDRPAASAAAALARVLADGGRAYEAAVALSHADDPTGALAERLRAELGDRRFVEAWAEGRSRAGVPGVA